MISKIFLGGPFKGLIDPQTGIMKERYINTFSGLLNFFSSRGYDVHNAHVRENWGANFWSPDECTKLDYEEICKADAFVAFPGSPSSPGTHIELGWASAHAKKIVLMLEEGEYYCHLTKGLHTVADVEYIYYKNDEEILSSLSDMFPNIKSNAA